MHTRSSPVAGGPALKGGMPCPGMRRPACATVCRAQSGDGEKRHGPCSSTYPLSVAEHPGHLVTLAGKGGRTAVIVNASGLRRAVDYRDTRQVGPEEG